MINDAVKTGHEAASWSVVPPFEVVGVVEPDVKVLTVKDTKKKCHRDGTSSGSHYHKKLKEPPVCRSSDGVILSSKSGIGSKPCVFPEVDGVILASKSVMVMLIRYILPPPFYIL